MPKKKPPVRMPPFDDPHEWFYIDWEHRIVIRHLEMSVANSIEYAMPPEYRTENGCKVIRLDNGETVAEPLSYSHCYDHRLTYFDDFDNTRRPSSVRFRDDRTHVETTCKIIPGVIVPPEETPKTKAKAAAKSVAKPPARPPAKLKPRTLFD